MKKESQKKKSSDKVEMFKTGGGTLNLLSTSLDEQLTAMGALIEPLPCRFNCDHEFETAVSSGTQVEAIDCFFDFFCVIDCRVSSFCCRQNVLKFVPVGDGFTIEKVADMEVKVDDKVDRVVVTC
ncbi:hypothetical protein TNCT_5061 [Trichonephila clavata]|uniref:Uncharacterized protein n=1 Tax=Trichonephila clavata TaxID=2740835 RepID=A0A8X6G9W9_TRICU|nr:hypothetical protein TNCT_5061 [Trichonephila clavata]